MNSNSEGIKMREFIERGVSESVEFKSSLSEWREIVKTISAFANTKGGIIIVGIDTTNNILGVKIGKKTIKDLANRIKENTDPKIYPSISVSVDEGDMKKKIIVIKVKESKSKPVFAFVRVYKRVGKSNQRVSSDEIRKKVLEGKKIYWDEKADLFGQPRVSNYKCMWSWNLRKKFVLKNTEDHMMSLDAGCGSGELTKIIIKKGSIAMGLDISSKRLFLAKKHNNIQNVIQGELSHLPFKNNVFTHVLCIEVIQNISDIDNTIREMSRVLKRGGKLVMFFPNYYYYPYQRRISKGEDISNKNRRGIIHKNEDIYVILQKNGIKIKKVNKIPYNLPYFICFSIGIVGVKHEMV